MATEYTCEKTEPYVKDNKVVQWGLTFKATNGDVSAVTNEIVDVPEDDQKALADWTNEEIQAFRDGIKDDRGWTSELEKQVGGGELVANWDNASLSVSSE